MEGGQQTHGPLGKCGMGWEGRGRKGEGQEAQGRGSSGGRHKGKAGKSVKLRAQGAMTSAG